ncbi:S-DNA-T family DNA segregation ATPase FtsK/SpoIIIE [Microbacterium ginsengiterrae]|uniref:S-DNA-T family DNA segregation ATPase FtsK/SpoIIIE n=1 Tax=Microbacterium ginsengiterrae TaxID=546115 RepID=A0A7W9CDX8_9MICO|nr:FtsK/SpoIIIE domain-containing protein [Microbacterium ginsengiterrae]MBB5743857.1 S-DNA-T family DNA segregation ATPase FtsK/SpoIIIE [Microbacterium ginsengiterrae]
MDAESLTLPAAVEEPPRQPVPVLAALVPMAGGVVLWLITGSVFSLCFAALGPLMMGASLVDGARTRRRARRHAAERADEGWRRAEQQLRERHRRERREMWRETPDAAAALADQPLRDLHPVDESTPIVVGTGARRSVLRVSGDEGERAREFRERAGQLENAPVVAPLGRGVCIRGPLPVTSAAARALVVQLSLRHSPVQLALSGAGLETLGIAGLPHAGRPRRGAWRVAVVIGDEEAGDAPCQIRLREGGGEVPEGITTVLDVSDPSRGSLRMGTVTSEVRVECLSRPQALVVAAERVEREGAVAQLPDAVALSDLVVGEERTGLSAAIGRTDAADLVLDLVEDGPHAVVTGMTGSGKSELLVTWIASMARAHGPDEVSFVLADFKGGTAFDPLQGLPHVAAVITDLDEEGARRGVESLTAELRRREGLLAEMAVRSVAESDGRVGRLVIVVDEFAALVQEHPDLAVVFTDIAARGRALGMHLILGTQRAAGVIRDALAANCPLRVSLRVTDAADSRTVIGSDEAAELPGGAHSRGLAYVRRPQDTHPVAVRIALTGASDLRGIAASSDQAATRTSPWLPPLPRMLDLRDPTVRHDGAGAVLGLRDEPALQRQTPVLLMPGTDRGIAIIGGSGSGRSSALRLLAAQCPSALTIADDPEQAWDAITALDDGGPASSLILCDDLDRLIATFPAEHGTAFVDRLERVIRSAGDRGCTVAVTTAKVNGQIARIVDALPLRALLRTGTKMEHLAAGGDGDGFLRDRPPGRARIGADEVQLAWIADDTPRSPSTDPTAQPWAPTAGVVGVVAPGVRRVVEALRTAVLDAEVTPIAELAGEVAGASVIHPSSIRRVLVGDPDSWQRHWSLWQAIRASGEMLVLAECAAELRTLAGSRELPPYAHPHRGRAWSIVDGSPPRRVLLPQVAPR